MTGKSRCAGGGPGAEMVRRAVYAVERGDAGLARTAQIGQQKKWPAACPEPRPRIDKRFCELKLDRGLSTKTRGEPQSQNRVVGPFSIKKDG